MQSLRPSSQVLPLGTIEHWGNVGRNAFGTFRGRLHSGSKDKHSGLPLRREEQKQFSPSAFKQGWTIFSFRDATAVFGCNLPQDWIRHERGSPERQTRRHLLGFLTSRVHLVPISAPRIKTSLGLVTTLQARSLGKGNFCFTRRLLMI